LEDNELVLTNTSTVDPSFSEADVQYQWTFKKLDLGVVPVWETWQTIDDYIGDDLTFNQPPLRVRETVMIDAATAGVLPRQVVLGSDEMVVQFAEGTTFVRATAEPYAGELQLSDAQEQVQIAGQQLIAVYETGIEVPVDVSETARLLFNGII